MAASEHSHCLRNRMMCQVHNRGPKRPRSLAILYTFEYHREIANWDMVGGNLSSVQARRWADSDGFCLLTRIAAAAAPRFTYSAICQCSRTLASSPRRMRKTRRCQWLARWKLVCDPAQVQTCPPPAGESRREATRFLCAHAQVRFLFPSAVPVRLSLDFSGDAGGGWNHLSILTDHPGITQ